MSAHSEIANIVKKNYTGHALGVAGFAQEGSHHHIGSARLIDHCGSKGIVIAAKAFKTFCEQPFPQVGSTSDHNPCGLPSRMGIDDVDSVHVRTHFHKNGNPWV